MRDNTRCPISPISDMCRFSVRGQQCPRTLHIEHEIQRAQLFEHALGELPPFLGSEFSPHTELDELLSFETECVTSDTSSLTWHVLPLPTL